MKEEGPFYKRREDVRLKSNKGLHTNITVAIYLYLNGGLIDPLFPFPTYSWSVSKRWSCTVSRFPALYVSPQHTCTHNTTADASIAHAIHISSIGTTSITNYPKTFPLFFVPTLLLHKSINNTASPRLGLVRRDHSCPHCPPIPKITRNWCWKLKHVYVHL